MGPIDQPLVPIHVEDNPYSSNAASENLVYCRRCRHKFGGACGAISAGACDWGFCPYCGVEIVKTNPYHHPTEDTWRAPGDWRLSESEPEVWGEVIEGRARSGPRELNPPVNLRRLTS